MRIDAKCVSKSTMKNLRVPLKPSCLSHKIHFNDVITSMMGIYAIFNFQFPIETRLN